LTPAALSSEELRDMQAAFEAMAKSDEAARGPRGVQGKAEAEVVSAKVDRSCTESSIVMAGLDGEDDAARSNGLSAAMG
jgi:hypothetical protein